MKSSIVVKSAFMKLKITLKDGTEKTIEAREVTEDYATRTCQGYGWGIRSAAWHDLAKSASAHPGFLKKHAEKMYPEAMCCTPNEKLITTEMRGSDTMAVDLEQGGSSLSSPSNCSATGYEYGTLTEDFLKALPDKPMSLGEALCGDSKAARRCRQLCAAYGPIAAGAIGEAMQIKYKSPNVRVSKQADNPEG